MRNKIIFVFITMLLLLINTSAKRKNIENNFLKNGNFESRKENWFDFNMESGKGSIDIKNGEAVVTIKNEGTVYWSVCLGQAGVKLEKDHIYQVSFFARSDSIKKIRSLFQLNKEPYQSYSGSHSFNLTEKMKKHSFSFTMRHDSDNEATLIFQFGKQGLGKVYLDNVTVEKIGKKEVLNIPTDFPKPVKNKILRGITFGNVLDAPNEGEWGPELKEQYFKIIAEKKVFDHIRIPIRWETHTSKIAPYTIDPEFLKRVDWAVSNSLHHGLYVIINMHHHTEFENNPIKNKEKFLSMWDQISNYFKDYPDSLYFEIYNEPGSRITGDKSNTLENPKIWNKIWVEAYNIIRKTNPKRKIIITGPIWANIDALPLLNIPKNIEKDPNIMIQFHFYYPVKFCFQGSFGNMFEEVKNIRWRGSQNDRKQILSRIKKIKDWSKKHNNQELWNGEFCAHNTGGSLKEDRLKWTSFIAKTCEENGIAWAYWDFHGDTSNLYDIHEDKWDDELIAALIGK